MRDIFARRSIMVLLVPALAMIAVVLVAVGSQAAEATTATAAGDRGPLPELGPDDTGDDVLRLQMELAAAGFYNHRLDGVYDEKTATAVVAFHKYMRTARTDVFTTVDWHLLRNLPAAGLPDRGEAADYVEVDIERQLLFLIRDGSLEGILPVSTGGDHTYWSVRNQWYGKASTPRGNFTLRWNQTGWACDSVTGWCVYKYWAFTHFYGIHGYASVPTTPASHGCVRLNLWDSDWIEDRLFIGMSVHIWDEPPAAAMNAPASSSEA